MIWVSVGLVFVSLLGGGEETVPILTAKEHPWGRWEPGAYRTVQTEISAKAGDNCPPKVHREVRTELKSVDKTGLVLQETDLREQKRQTIISLDFYQETAREGMQVRQGEPSKLLIGNSTIPCRTRIYEQKTADGLLSVKVWYSAQIYPYVLRAERVLRSAGDAADAPAVWQQIMSVQETSAIKPKLRKENNREYLLLTVEKTASGIRRETEEQCSWNIPGGVLYATTKEFNEKDEEIRVSVSRTTSYRGRWR